jgi:hypothetical protein
MRLGNFYYLMARNQRIRRSRLFSARLGIGFAVFFLTLGLGAAMGAWRSLQPVLEKVFPPQTLIVRPAALNVALLRVRTGTITDSTLDCIRAIPGVRRVNAHMPVQFPLHARGKLGPMQEEIVTEIAVHGVGRAVVADALNAGEPFVWELEDSRPCPVVISSYFLDLYNLGLAESNRLPQFNERALIGKTFTLVLGVSAILGPGDTERYRQVQCAVAGFTRDPNLAGVALPIEAVRSFNRWYLGENYEATYTLAQVETASVGDIERVAGALGELGLSTSVPGQMLERWRWIVRGVFALLWAIGLGVLLIALVNTANTFALVLMERRDEIGMYRAVGATRRLIHRLYLAEAAWVGISASLGGALLAWGAAAAATGYLKSRVSFPASLGEFTFLPDWWLAAAIVIGVGVLSMVVSWPTTMRMTRAAPAELLKG